MPTLMSPPPRLLATPETDEYEAMPSTELAARWREGEHRAAKELFNRYFDQLRRMVHSRVNRRFSSRMCNDEIVQSAFGSVFRMTRDRPQDFANDEAFRRWLVTVVLNKTFKRIEHESAQKRDPAREQSMQATEGFAAYVAERLGETPDIEGVLEMSELLETLNAALPEHLQQLIRLRLEDYNQVEIAAELGVTTRTVRRWSDELNKKARVILMKELRD